MNALPFLHASLRSLFRMAQGADLIWVARTGSGFLLLLFFRVPEGQRRSGLTPQEQVETGLADNEERPEGSL